MFQDRIFFPQGVNMYVPAMTGSAEFGINDVVSFDFGTPALSDNDCVIAAAGIDSDAVAGTEVATTLGWVSDAPYGRNLIMTISGDPGAASSVVDVYGWDYLGQPMIERFTFANGVAGKELIQYGNKAFYRVAKTRIITASTNAVTARLGTGSQLGLPYFGDVVWAIENNGPVQIYNRDIVQEIHRSRDDCVAGHSTWVKAPCAGWVSKIRGWPDGGGGVADPVITVELGGVAITGMTITINTSEVATGNVVSDVPDINSYSGNTRVDYDDLIEIVCAAAAGAFGDTIELTITPVQCISGDVTDPATRITGDPRGMYTPNMVMDGVKPLLIGLRGIAYVNASGNGGLHGIQHFTA